MIFLSFVVKGTATGQSSSCIQAGPWCVLFLHFWCSSTELLLMSGPTILLVVVVLVLNFPYIVLWWRKEGREYSFRLPLLQQPKQMDPAASSHRPWPARWVEWSKSMRTPMMAEVGSRQINHVVALSYVSIALALKNLGESPSRHKTTQFFSDSAAPCLGDHQGKKKPTTTKQTPSWSSTSFPASRY